MSFPSPDPAEVVTPSILGLILGSPRLRDKLFPEGITHSPYEVLEYRSTLTLHDRRGMHATLERRERIRFLQEGVSAILDHAWGDGVVVTSYKTDAGTIEGCLRDEGKRHLLIRLERPMYRGEVLEFKVERTLVAAFTQADEWLETVIDHPVRQVTCNVVFPRERPSKRAVLEYAGAEMSLPIVEGSNGQTLVQFHKTLPKAHTSFILKWSW